MAGYSPWGHEESDTTERLSTAQGKRNKNKNKQIGTILHSKGNHQHNEKTTCGMGEYICR